ncbi:hypothetical protein D3C84_726380 [compost metagenome]
MRNSTPMASSMPWRTGVGGSVMISSRSTTVLPTSSTNSARDSLSRWRYCTMVSSASRRVGWCDSSRLMTPKSESWRDSAMRRPKVGQLLSWADSSSRQATAEEGKRCSGFSISVWLRPALRSICCGLRPRCWATSM